MKFRLPLGEKYYDFQSLRELAFLVYPLNSWRHSLIKGFLDFSRELSAPDNILEIGCGNGFFSKILSYRFPKTKILSIDTSLKSIAHAEKRNLTNVTFKREDFFNVKGKYDLITSLHVFILLEPKSALKKVKELLKDGGIAFITYTKKTPFTELHRRFYRVVVGDDIVFKGISHITTIAKELKFDVKTMELNSQEGSFALILKSKNGQDGKKVEHTASKNE